MPWLQVKLATSADSAPAIEEALTEAGAVSVTLEGADDSRIFEPAPGEVPLWDATRVVGLFEDDHAHESILAALAGLDDEIGAEPEFEQVPDREWTRAWMDDWAPLRFGDHLWVAPEDATVDDPDGTVLRLDPGLAFGTGTHATTALCLEWLAAHDLTGLRVLDYGCGSGILAVAALRLGAAHAHAVDIDPQALEATMANAEKNGVAARVETADEETLID
ncbi:MAG: 50S ribosomal protein L11 methyltransferase, partial [Halofilum sp. (in: g-proteobacteria)]